MLVFFEFFANFFQLTDTTAIIRHYTLLNGGKKYGGAMYTAQSMNSFFLFHKQNKAYCACNQKHRHISH